MAVNTRTILILIVVVFVGFLFDGVFSYERPPPRQNIVVAHPSDSDSTSPQQVIQFTSLLRPSRSYNFCIRVYVYAGTYISGG